MTASSTTWAESADVVGRLKSMNIASSSPVPSSPPAAVTARLTKLSLTWANLSVMEKQALLWDMGFVQTDTNTYTQVYTSCESSGQGMAMAAIALTKAELGTLDVSACGGVARLDAITVPAKLLKCAIPASNIAYTSNSSVWSQDGLPATAAIDVRSVVHLAANLVAIHIVPSSTTDASAVPIGSCPEAPGGLSVPCAMYAPPAGSSSGWCLPPPSDAMTAWLLDVRAALPTPSPANVVPASPSSSSSSSAAVVVLSVLLAVAVLVVFGLWWIFVRRPRKQRATDSPGGFLGNAFLRHNNVRRVGDDEADEDSYERSMQEINVGTAAASLKLEAFEHDPFLYSRRLPYGAITTSRLISKGAYGEVWLGTFRGKEVAIKKILHSKRNDTFEQECFTEEIRIMAALDHPHIVHLIGFGWNTLSNLCAVTEYLAKGDVTGYLVANMDLSWDAKLRLAVGTARALAYLHGRSPPVIHRDLKSKNILVSDTGEAKLSDFGISRVRIADETMTVGVGTVYWTAPEVLLGQKYTEQVDIYSFGVVLCELDTHRAPYADMQEVAQMAIAQRVATHQFRPPFSAKCPKLVKDLADRCMAQDPAARPCAQEIVDLIELWKGWKQ
ncbi:protein kinase [Achlya hypogyna]|uniref:Protein kinase n=1 Tax=Achlya hypogyna TaxID=1202772 RepID=A0A1V9ZET4_ACHHY|nr:protein kinase [Achlya hypogyna]